MLHITKFFKKKNIDARLEASKRDIAIMTIYITNLKDSIFFFILSVFGFKVKWIKIVIMFKRIASFSFTFHHSFSSLFGLSVKAYRETAAQRESR